MSANPFGHFYDKQVEICKFTTGNSYSDRGNKAEVFLSTITVDIQPYSGGLAAEQYGLNAECQYRMFSDTCEHISEGNYVKFNGNRHKIIYVRKWSLGVTALLQLER